MMKTIKTIKHNGIRYDIERNNGVEVLLRRKTRKGFLQVTLAYREIPKRLHGALKSSKTHTDYHTVKNVMSGALVQEAVDTPYGCSVGDEAYWCN
jgi:hypothetical protein